MKKEIDFALRASKVNRTICAKCGLDLDKEGYVVETEAVVYASCEACLEGSPPQKPHEARKRAALYERLERYGLPSTDERVIHIALDLGLKVLDRKGNEILWSFAHRSGGFSPDGNDAPSWYGKAATRWTSFVIREPGGAIVRAKPRYPVTIAA